MSRPDRWKDDALCADLPPAMFDVDNHSTLADIEAARAVCAMCPVQQTCLDSAIDNHEVGMMWGGHTETERTTIRNRRNRSRAKRAAAARAGQATLL